MARVARDRSNGGAEPTGWRLQLLGGLRLFAPGGAERTPKSRKGRALLAYLALEEGRPVGREQLAGLLWGDRPEEQARASLRQTLRELRSCLGEPGPLRAGREAVALDTGRIEVDALRLIGLARAPRPEIDLCELAVGELLEGTGELGGPFDTWLAAQRARLRAIALDALQRRLEATGEEPELRRLGARILALEPAHEPAHRALMLLYARRGDTVAAIRQFEACREALARHLDARPSEPTMRLLAQIRAGAVAAPVAVARGEATEARRTATAVVVAPLRESGEPTSTPRAGEVLAEEIAAALARFRWIAVLATGPAADPEQAEPAALARRTGARYVVSGRIVHAPERTRLRLALLEGATGRLLWTEHETLEPDELATHPAEIAQPMAARLARELLIQESLRADPERLTPAEAPRLILRAARLVQTLEAAELEEATHLLERVLELTPEDAVGHAWLATAHLIRAGYPWRAGHAGLLAQANAAAARALQLDPLEPIATCTLAQIRVLERQFDQALWLCDRAIAANPALPMAWARRALLLCYRGEPDAALAAMARYRRLSPLDPLVGLFGRVEIFAHLLAGRYEAAVAAARPLIARRPTSFGCYLPMLAALGHLGRRAEAAAYLADVRRIEPEFSLAAFLCHYPLARERDLEHYARGLRAAGLEEPEHGTGVGSESPLGGGC